MAATTTAMPAKGGGVRMAHILLLKQPLFLTAGAGERPDGAGDGARLAFACARNAGNERRGALRAAPLRQQLIQSDLAHRRLERLGRIGPAVFKHLQIIASSG